MIRRLNGKVFHDKPLLVCSHGDCSSELHHYQRTVVIGNKEQYLTHSAICKRFAPYGRVLLCMQPKIRHRPSNAVVVLLESADVASLCTLKYLKPLTDNVTGRQTRIVALDVPLA